MALACGRGFTLFATEHGDLYGCGLNDKQQLPHTSFRSVALPSRVARVHFGGEDVAMVAASEFLGAAVTKEGSLFCWGRRWTWYNNSSRIDARDLGDSPVAMADCSCETSVAVTAAGRVFTWGERFTFLPGGIFSAFQIVPSKCFDNKKIVKISCGFDHTLAIDEANMLWTWGANDSGQLCMGFANENSGTTASPVRIESVDGSGVMHATGGRTHTMVVTAKGSIWACGVGPLNQMGLGTQTTALQLTRVTGVDNFGGCGVRMTACGDNHTIFVDLEDRIWVCGSGLYLSLGFESVFCTEPTQIPDTSTFKNRNVMFASVGYTHSAVVMRNGDVYTWGKGLFCQKLQLFSGLGHGTIHSQVTPHLLRRELLLGANVGHWHRASWRLSHRQHVHALLMGITTHLGDQCPYQNIPVELILRILDDGMHFEAKYSMSVVKPGASR